jgi:hypothetical protein
LIPRHLMSMLHEDDGEVVVGQVEGHSGAVAAAAAQQEVELYHRLSYRSPVRNRITGSSGADGMVVGQRAARIEQPGFEVVANVVAVPVAVADSGELRAARVVRGRAGMVCAGLALPHAHLRRHQASLSKQAERIQLFRRLTRGHHLSGVHWTVEGGQRSQMMDAGEERAAWNDCYLCSE